MWVPERPDGRLVIGANRDESPARATASPSGIEPGIVAGRDLEKGGTWLGFTDRGLFVAVTNRFTPAPSPDSYSRGLLTLEALRCDGVDAAAALVRSRVASHPMAGFNLVVLVGNVGLSLHFDGKLRETAIGPGRHVMSSNFDINDPKLPEKREFDRFVAEHPGTPAADDLRTFLSSHTGTRPVCKHGEVFGTVSSTILESEGGQWSMWYAAGRPCTTPWAKIR